MLPPREMKDMLIKVAVKDMDQGLKEKIARDVEDYSVGLFMVSRDTGRGIPIGSGTLVGLDKHYGLVTAGHVVTTPRLLRNQWSTELGLAVAAHEHRFSIPTNLLARQVVWDGVECADKPDIAYIEIPEPKASELRARKSFYNLDHSRNAASLENIPLEGTCWVLVDRWPTIHGGFANDSPHGRVNRAPTRLPHTCCPTLRTELSSP